MTTEDIYRRWVENTIPCGLMAMDFSAIERRLLHEYGYGESSPLRCIAGMGHVDLTGRRRGSNPPDMIHCCADGSWTLSWWKGWPL